MDFKEQIALLHLEEVERPEDNLNPKKSKYYVPIPRNKWRRGKHERTEESRKRQSESMRRYWNSERAQDRRKASRDPENPDRRCLPRSPEYRQYMSEYIRESYRNNPERKRKARERMKTIPKHVWTEEDRQRHSELQRQYKWYTNGTEQIRTNGPCPEGWWRGRLKVSQKTKDKTSESMKRSWDNKRDNNG